MVDLACGHVAAVKKLEQTNVGCVPVNLGTGTAYSVLEMLAGVGKACGKTLPHKMCPRCARAANTHPSPQLSRAQAGRRCVQARWGRGRVLLRPCFRQGVSRVGGHTRCDPDPPAPFSFSFGPNRPCTALRRLRGDVRGLVAVADPKPGRLHNTERFAAEPCLTPRSLSV